MAHIGRPTRDPLPFGPGLNAHRRVVSVAIEIANAWWEQYAACNHIYRRMRAGGQNSERDARRLFVERVAPRALEEARLALTDMLTVPDHVMPPAQKAEIAEALILDNDLRAKRIVAERHLTH